MIMNDKGGFSLIEVIVALAVLSIGIFALYSLQLKAMEGNTKANAITEAAKLGSDQLEQTLDLDYLGFASEDDVNPAVDLSDNDGDGIGGINDVSATATPPGRSDGVATSPDGNYTIFWNVANDYPMPGTKTIRVITRNNNDMFDNNVVVDYIKNDGI